MKSERIERWKELELERSILAQSMGWAFFLGFLAGGTVAAMITWSIMK